MFHLRRLRKFASSLTHQGFSSLELDLALSPPTQTLRTSEDVLENATSAITTGPSPFPPVFIPRGLASLVSQTYISSHPATAVLRIDPPASKFAVNPFSSPEIQRSLQTNVKEFDFESCFPVSLISTPDSSSNSLVENGLVLAGADVFLAKRKEDVMRSLESWLDELDEIIGGGAGKHCRRPEDITMVAHSSGNPSESEHFRCMDG
ncbi:hypothetical protein BD410DRAFT_844268 [Rickenella mellea]|uniref:Uncharacterized protein n=1 Tax=Rickenella mellea TaxID=50990 RepID=A0A4Y7PMH3_9AGAM|nr:hypothetical protein BD410DRAFT_844268 [Rickenella mellea]